MTSLVKFLSFFLSNTHNYNVTVKNPIYFNSILLIDVYKESSHFSRPSLQPPCLKSPLAHQSNTETAFSLVSLLSLHLVYFQYSTQTVKHVSPQKHPVQLLISLRVKAKFFTVPGKISAVSLPRDLPVLLPAVLPFAHSCSHNSLFAFS